MPKFTTPIWVEVEAKTIELAEKKVDLIADYLSKYHLVSTVCPLEAVEEVEEDDDDA